MAPGCRLNTRLPDANPQKKARFAPERAARDLAHRLLWLFSAMGNESVAPRKVLIIEDDASVRECYGRLFRRHGYQAALEANGASVERNLERHRDAQVVILDFRMPGMNGLELLARLRERRFLAPAFLVTAQSEAEISEPARRLGVSCIFPKPLDIRRLMAAVEVAVQSSNP